MRGRISRLFGRGSLFGRRAAEREALRPASAPARAPAAAHAPESPKAGDAHETYLKGLVEQIFLKRLEAIFLKNPGPVSGKIHFLDLERLRAQFGDRWPQLLKKIHSIADDTIGRHLTPDDIFMRLRDDAYVIVFAQLPKRNAQATCSRIAEEIIRRVAGSEGADNLVEVKAAVRKLEGKVLQHDETIADALDEAWSSPGAGGTEIIEVGRRGGGQRGVGPRETGRTPRTLDAETAPPRREGHTVYVYHPVWNARSSLISAYFCQSARQRSDGTAVLDDDVLVEKEGNLLLLDTVANHLEQLRGRDEQVLFLVPVHYEAIAGTASRLELHQFCRALPRDQRHRIVLTLVHAPAGIPQGRVREVVGYLKPHCRSVAVHLPLDQTDFSLFAGLGLAAVCCFADRAGDPEGLFQQMDQFAARAGQHRLPACIGGIDSRRLLAAALCADFGYISGNAIAPTLSGAHPAFRFSGANPRELIGSTVRKARIAEAAERGT